MNIDEVLLQEEANRRLAVKRRNQEIKKIMEEDLDFRGRLWGEKTISELCDEKNTDIKDTDVEAKIFPHNSTPEEIFSKKEIFCLAKKIIIEKWGNNEWNIFLHWLDNESLEKLSEDFTIMPFSLINLVREMVLEIRKETGNTSSFPFGRLLSSNASKKIKEKILKKRTMEGKSFPADPLNRIFLSIEEKSLSVDDLWLKIKQRGHQIARSTAWRAKKQGFYMKPGWERGGGDKVYLTAEDKERTGKELAEKYGISAQRANLSKKRGYFVVNQQNIQNIRR